MKTILAIIMLTLLLTSFAIATAYALPTQTQDKPRLRDGSCEDCDYPCEGCERPCGDMTRNRAGRSGV